MTDATITSAIKALESLTEPVSPGVHNVSYSLVIKEHNSNAMLSLSVDGTVSKGETEQVIPTVSVPWIQVCAELLRSCGVTGDSAINRLRDALTKVLTTDADITDVLSKSIADATARIKKEILAKLPLAEREGKTKIAQTVVESFVVNGVEHDCSVGS